MLINIDGATVEDNLLIIEDRSVAYRVVLNILVALSLTDNKVPDEQDERPVWPGKK